MAAAQAVKVAAAGGPAGGGKSVERQGETLRAGVLGCHT